MADYNIQMHSYNDEGEYDKLYPKTKASNVVLDSGETLQEYINNIPDFVLNNNDYDIISEVSLAGVASSYWSIGDVKWVPINWAYGGTTFNGKFGMVIIGFDHNKSVETGSSSSIHFQFMYWNSAEERACLCDNKYDGQADGACFNMNTTNTNSGGWSSSYMRSTVIPSFKNALPSDLQSVIRTIIKYTSRPNSTAASTSTSDDIFLLSEKEIYGSISCSGSASNQVQYSYYSGKSITTSSYANAIMYKHSDTNTAAFWWERSPYKSTATAFCCTTSDGKAYYSTAYSSYGFAPCLCI